MPGLSDVGGLLEPGFSLVRGVFVFSKQQGRKEVSMAKHSEKRAHGGLKGGVYNDWLNVKNE